MHLVKPVLEDDKDNLMTFAKGRLYVRFELQNQKENSKIIKAKIEFHFQSQMCALLCNLRKAKFLALQQRVVVIAAVQACLKEKACLHKNNASV